MFCVNHFSPPQLSNHLMYHQQQNNVSLKDVYLSYSKLYSVLAVANLLAHNNTNQICYCSQFSLQSGAVNCRFSDNLAPFGCNIYFVGDGTQLFSYQHRIKFVVLSILHYVTGLVQLAKAISHLLSIALG